MSFLLRRNRPKAIAAWYDNYNRPNEDPIQKPWYIWGGIPHDAAINANRMWHKPFNGWVGFGGWSYEHTCFTSSWGVTFDFNCSKGGVVAEDFRVILNKPAWTRKNANNFEDILCLSIQYRASFVGPRLMIVSFDDISSVGNIYQEEGISASEVFDGNWHNFTIKIDQDRLVRVYLDGALRLNVGVPIRYGSSDKQRTVNYMNSLTTDVYTDNFILFDQYPPDPPFNVYNWSSIFYDDFNRANSSTIGNGWTKLGTNSAIESNSYTTVSTTDGHRGILRDTGITNGVQRVEAVIGGANGPKSSVESSLIIRSTSDGSSALAANVFSNKVYIARMTGSMTDPSMNDFAEGDVSFASGDKVAFSCNGSWVWVEKNGETVLTAETATAGMSQSYVGAKVRRASFNDSHSWNDYRILS